MKLIRLAFTLLLIQCNSSWSLQAPLSCHCRNNANVCVARHHHSSRNDMEESLPPRWTIKNESIVNRRRLVCQSVLLGSIGGCLWSLPTRAIADESVSDPDYTVFSDLPPVQDGWVRLYLCRHGQTENNRLKLMQGAKVDAPLNDNGTEQAKRLGKALSLAAPVPEITFHSSLTRARQTASLAASQIIGPRRQSPPPLQTIPELGEIDFGSVDRAAVESVRAQMVATYTAWGLGQVDTKMAEDGESLVQILARVQIALQTLIAAAAACPSRSVAAVAHSVYLRLLLAVVQDLPLLQLSTLPQPNAGVNVIDFRIDESQGVNRIGAKSAVIGGILSQAPADFRYDLPMGRVLRTSEKRHLGELAT
eukprot:CAMPEP_0172441900 /NCGR_PEP_ID=MMETSP1065-20121228/2411_1 /TAXON_ID=265537 /ORGANISM="Amphiprora paludosa, Strain CCMP125" /LENGTH=363 /DNA_ID=CAMNT_0013191511 /DNA_START=288 /DNA_END=1379 /DNA_ORIENTATION=+